MMNPQFDSISDPKHENAPKKGGAFIHCLLQNYSVKMEKLESDIPHRFWREPTFEPPRKKKTSDFGNNTDNTCSY